MRNAHTISETEEKKKKLLYHHQFERIAAFSVLLC
jgi:hypothetical protein